MASLFSYGGNPSRKQRREKHSTNVLNSAYYYHTIDHYNIDLFVEYK